VLRFEFTTEELNLIKSKIHFTPRQIRIIDYRMDEIPIVQMAQKEVCDVSTINREIKKIKKKITKVV
jgi:hypothetical protein